MQDYRQWVPEAIFEILDLPLRLVLHYLRRLRLLFALLFLLALIDVLLSIVLFFHAVFAVQALPVLLQAIWVCCIL